LESAYPGNWIAGSNPVLSATSLARLGASRAAHVVTEGAPVVRLPLRRLWIRRDGAVVERLTPRRLWLRDRVARLPPDAEVSADRTSWWRVADLRSRHFTPTQPEASAEQSHVELLRVLTARTPATHVLILLNIAVWILCVVAGVGPFKPAWSDLLDVGAKSGPLVVQGEWWRLLSSLFLHKCLVHLVFNMLGLLVVGALLEALVGSAGFLAIYLGSGVLASLVGLARNPLSGGVGASGAIFGVAGAFAVVLWRQRRRAMPAALLRRFGPTLFIVAVVEVVGALFMPGKIAHGVHLAGFGCGALLGLLAANPLTVEGMARRRAGALRVATFSVAAAIGGALLLPRPDLVQRDVRFLLKWDDAARLAVDAIRQGDSSDRLTSVVLGIREGLEDMGRQIQETESLLGADERTRAARRLADARRIALDLGLETLRRPASPPESGVADSAPSDDRRAARDAAFSEADRLRAKMNQLLR
jgi:membrane associated rhomboid family serine protease